LTYLITLCEILSNKILHRVKEPIAQLYRRNHMPTLKQIQSRLLNKKNSLNKVNINLVNAEKSKNKILLRKLNQEKGILERHIRKLERELIMEKKASKEKKTMTYPSAE